MPEIKYRLSESRGNTAAMVIAWKCAASHDTGNRGFDSHGG